MRVRLDFAATVAKDPERPDLNEDAFKQGLNSDVFALSDGASESYDSKSWAQMLVSKYSENLTFNYEWVEAAQKNYAATVDFQSLSWSKQLAFDRGSFATLLGLTTFENSCSVFSIGDSLAALVRNKRIHTSFPFVYPEQFDARPELLSTLSNLNTFAQDSEFNIAEHQTSWEIEDGDTVFMMTDAVGQWFLREINFENSSAQALLDTSTEDEFQSLICLLRSEKRIKLDDSTLLRFVVDSSDISNGISND